MGSHGGLGGPQQHAVLVHPRSFEPPGEVVGAEALHRVLRGWLTDLGHPEPEPADDGDQVREAWSSRTSPAATSRSSTLERADIRAISSTARSGVIW